MSLKNDGFLFFESDEVLVELIIVDREHGVRESIYEPNEGDIRRVCEEHDLDLEKTLTLIRTKNPDVHTMIIDVPLYRAFLEEQTFDHKDELKEVSDGGVRGAESGT